MASAEQGQARLVLVVDDDDHIREVAALALTVVGGLRVVTAHDGPSALESALTDRPDAVLLDVRMPGMTGIETLARLKKDERTAATPVILLTASLMPHDASPETDAVGIISKPFDPMTLAAQTRSILGWQ